jgi:ferritin-like metal-binding protein YciE
MARPRRIRNRRRLSPGTAKRLRTIWGACRQKVFDVLGRRARGITCEAINGPIEEGEEVVEEFLAGSVRDAGLAACAQAIEHYEMVRLRRSDRLGKDRQPEGDRDAA